MNLYIEKSDISVKKQKRLITVLMILELQFFNILEVKTLENYNTVSNKMLILGIVLFYVFFNYILGRKNKLDHRCVYFTNTSMKVLILMIFVQACYTMPKYNESIVDIVRATGHLLLLSLSYVLLDIYLFEDDTSGVLNLISKLTFIAVFLYLVNAIINNLTGVLLLSFKVVQIRNGRPRMAMPIMASFMIIYEWFEFLSGDSKKNKHLIYVLVGLAGLFFFDMTRMLQISIVLSMLVMYFLRKNLTKYQVIFLIVLIAILVIVVNTNYFSGYLDSFSTTGSQGGSTSARLNAIRYFSKFTRDNLFLGMGMVRPYRTDLYRIYFGPVGTYNCLDDIGIFGLFYYYGLFGVVLYIMLLLRWGWILAHTKNSKNYLLLIGLFVFTISTSPSLIITNGQRALLIPIFFSVFEFTYYQTRIKV